METLLVEAFGPLIIAFVIYILAVGVRRFIHQMRNQLTPEQQQAARDSFRSRLLHPKQAEVEQALGGLLPQRLLSLYENHETILTEQMEIQRPDATSKHSKEWIEAFLPLDLESQKYTVDLSVYESGNGFCFATDGNGNFYWVPVSDSRAADAPVFFACYDPFGNDEVAPSLEEFLSWPRTIHAEEELSA